jgi:hypothetical protein
MLGTGYWMLDAVFQFRLFPLNFCLRSEACFHAFQIHSLLRASAFFRCALPRRARWNHGTGIPLEVTGAKRRKA